MRLKDRRILITGAGSGIGLATAELFLGEGARVAGIDRDERALKSAVARLGPERFAVFTADVTSEDQVRLAVDEAANQLDGLDGVVNAAGVDLQRSFPDMKIGEWQRVLSVNLTGPAIVCHAAMPALRRAKRGTIVNIASGAALRPLENRTAYCSAKAGLVMFSKALAVDLASFNIRVNAVCPGIIDTPMFRASYETSPDPHAELAKIMERFVIKRVGNPSDIANAALFLSCDESAYVTGAALAVDGGRTFH